MSEQTKSQNDKAWESLFEKYDILSHILLYQAVWDQDDLILVFRTLVQKLRHQFQ